ncbi:MAG: hypothetical protein LBR97_04075 [Dysgonamonadaceae bacterium]|jgi:hypothetical protein|nr:hypothetical protein [Dysgonamonadaceae bacterium]
MNFITAIKNRKTVCIYSGELLNDEHVAIIEEFIRKIQVPFCDKVRIQLVRSNRDNETTRLGSYGRVKGVYEFLAVIYEMAPLAEEASAYVLQKIILFCTNLGIGTCWLIDKFHHEAFTKQITLRHNEVLKMVTPIGYPSQKRRKFTPVMHYADSDDNYRPFEELFFYKDFNHPLFEDQAGIYSEPLEMVRWGLFGINRQSCRIIFDNNNLHFYKLPFEFAAIDTGIALCHFELSCIELKIKGIYAVVKHQLQEDILEYVISWISKQ